MEKRIIHYVFSLVLLSPGPLHANTEYRFSYQPAELQTSHGIASVYQRIEQTATDYCPKYQALPGARGARERKACVQEVVADLLAKVNHHGLNRYADLMSKHRRVVLAQRVF